MPEEGREREFGMTLLSWKTSTENKNTSHKWWINPHLQIIDLEYIEKGYNTCVLSIACLHDTEFYFPFQFIFIPLHSEVLEGLSAVLELPMPNRQYPTFLGLEDNF